MVRFFALIAACLIALPGFGLDKVRKETRVDDAISAYGVTGKNVIIALFDRGIGYEHMDFRNADGTTRIAYIFDLTDESGATDPSNSYGVGTIYTRDKINLALANGTTLATRCKVSWYRSQRNAPNRKIHLRRSTRSRQRTAGEAILQA